MIGMVVTCSLLADCVDLVDEDYGWGCLSGLLEEVSDSLGTDSYVHLHKLAAADCEEGDFALAGTCFG
jgi:hypothetical protein